MSEIKKRVIYIIGSLKNPQVPIVANKLRSDLGKEVEIFNDWYHSSDDADDWLHKCCKERGLTYKETLQTWGAKNTYEFDFFHLNRATDVIMVMPAGKSACLELGYSIGRGKRGYILFDKEPERVVIMFNFATDVFFDYQELVNELKKY
jgi:hypothetical protein